MNTGRKIFSRAFQKIMHALIPIFPYREPMILGDVEEITKLLKNKNIDKVLLVTDKGIRGMGLTAHLEAHLKENGIICKVYDGTVPNPTSDNVEAALEIYNNNNCQAIIGFGGGSSIDCAKVVGARAVCPRKPLNKMEEPPPNPMIA